MTPTIVDTTPRGKEETEVHTRMLRIGLAEADARVYWRYADPQMSESDKVKEAFEGRWFGSRTMARVRYLVRNFLYRFDAFPGSLQTLHRWAPTDIADRSVICHWHVQLSDPLYREFTSTFLGMRWARPAPNIDRSAAVRWVEEKTEGRWSSSTSQRMATGLLACAAEAGLCEKTKNTRSLSYPKVSDHALGYLLYLLKSTDYEGNLRENPFTMSVGIDGDLWEDRVRKLPWLDYRRMADVHDLKWHFENLEDWSTEVFTS